MLNNLNSSDNEVIKQKMINKQITIEICGIGFPNKGAELMLVAILQYLQHENIRWCMAPKNDYAQRFKYPLWQKTEVHRLGMNLASILAFLPWKIRRFFGLINESEIDVVFDASGFAYGDQWGLDNSKRLAKNIKRWKAQNKKIILFPQAFGPFKDNKHQLLIKKICNNSDLVFARDETSFNALALFNQNENIYLSPDFTPLVETEKTDYQNYICIIPNSKMLVKGSVDEKNNYIDFIVYQINIALKHTPKVLLLSHDGNRDKVLLDKILSKIDTPIDCLYIESALELKSIISNARIVISSRFHGLVSALSSGVPVIATGWSHKYQHLMNDYGVGEHLYKSIDKIAAGDYLEKLLSIDECFDETKKSLLHHADNQKNKIRAMWSKIVKIVYKDTVL